MLIPKPCLEAVKTKKDKWITLECYGLISSVIPSCYIMPALVVRWIVVIMVCPDKKVNFLSIPSYCAVRIITVFVVFRLPYKLLSSICLLICCVSRERETAIYLALSWILKTNLWPGASVLSSIDSYSVDVWSKPDQYALPFGDGCCHCKQFRD